MSRDLDADQKLCDETTEGPWVAEYSGEQGNCVIPHDAQSTREAVAVTRLYHQHADAEFIAMAREALPWYIAHVRELEAREQRRSTRPSDIDWQQLISRALGARPGQVTYSLHEATAKVEELREVEECPHDSWSGDGTGRWRCDQCGADQGSQDVADIRHQLKAANDLLAALREAVAKVRALVAEARTERAKGMSVDAVLCAPILDALEGLPE